MNKVKCLNCDMVLESKYIHDFVQCNCKNKTFTDGGNDYQRYGGVDMKLVKIIGETERT